ncbi:DUF6207 family protein [Streptomyces sp. NPDC018693]|uniref:DUF6207 family protein n=1 Tax=unclassified Streptomyces TaxID=2593676 RepID=UPI0037997955
MGSRDIGPYDTGSGQAGVRLRCLDVRQELAHVAEPGLPVVEIAATDDETAFAIQELIAARCAAAPADRTTREPGEPGVRLRCFLDLRQAPDVARRRPGVRRVVRCRRDQQRQSLRVPRCRSRGRCRRPTS